MFFLSNCASQKIKKEEQVLKEPKETQPERNQVSESVVEKIPPDTLGKIEGVVKDSLTGEPLPGVTIILKGTNLGTTTDIDGHYVIPNVPPGKYDISVSFMGYRDLVTKNVNISDDATNHVNFSLSAADIEPETAAIETGEREETPDVPETQPPASGYTIDSLLAELPTGNIAFNTPPRMNLEETAYIQLLLDLTKSVEDLKQKIEEKGLKEGDTIRVAPQMQALLIGSKFDITPITPEIQPITKQAVTEWKWEISPKQVGDHELHLTLNAIVKLEGDKATRFIKAFDRTLQVEVTWRQVTAGFLSENWQWLWAVVVAPVAGWFWRQRNRKKKGSKK